MDLKGNSVKQGNENTKDVLTCRGRGEQWEARKDVQSDVGGARKVERMKGDDGLSQDC